jgi:uncharacterized repeat protein (TIGR04138 family)
MSQPSESSSPRKQPPSLHEIARTTRYPVEAFAFVRRGLDYTVHSTHENVEDLSDEQRHVSGKQLCQGLRDYAVDQYGNLARTILKRWNIHRTEDFGRIVFAMVQSGLMQATENDTIGDFDSVFDFDGAFTCEIPVEHVPLSDPHQGTEQPEP